MREFAKYEAWELDASDFDAIVQEVFERLDFNFACAVEPSNDTAHTYSVEQRDLDAGCWDVDEDFNWKYPSIHDILVELVKRGEIPLGNYIINVSW